MITEKTAKWCKFDVLFGTFAFNWFGIIPVALKI